MKFNLLQKLFTLLMLIVSVSACKKLSEETSKKKQTKKVAIKVEPKSTKELKTRRSVMGLDKIAPIYLNYIRKNYTDFLCIAEDSGYGSTEVTYYKENDIDGDGKKEVLIAIGNSCDDCKADIYMNRIIILRNNNDKVEEITTDLGSYSNIADLVDSIDGGIVYVELVKLRGLKNYYILCKVRPEIYWEGLFIVKIQNNQPHIIFKSFPNGAYASSKLLDSDNDGKYDTLEENLGSISSIFEPTTTFKLIDGKFVVTKTEILLENYPETIEEVINNYTSLKKAKFKKCSQADSRIKELCISKSKAYNPVFDSYDAKINNVQVSGNLATADFSEKFSEERFYLKKFTLKKTGRKWQIVNIR